MSSFIDQVFGSSASGSDGASLVTIIIATGQEPSIAVNQPIGKQKKICTYPGCEKNVTRKGRCYRHNIPIQCGFPGCTKQVKCIKYCYSHRDHKMCKFEGCTSRALIKGLCGEHGNYHRCKAEGCNKYIVCKGGFCRTHGKRMFVLFLGVIIIQKHMDIVYAIETNKCVPYQHAILLLFPKEYATDIMLLLFVNMKDVLVEL